MEHNADLVEDLEKVVEELKADPHNSSAAFRLYEIAEHILRGFVHDFEMEYHPHAPSEETDEDTPESDEVAPPEDEPKTKPYAVVDHTPSFSTMRKDINEWLEPIKEFDSEAEAIEYLKENVEEGSVISTDWNIGVGEIIYAVTSE